MLFRGSMPMLRATSLRRLGKSLRALGAATSAGAAAGAIFQWTSPAVARADWDPRVVVGTMAGVVGAAAGGAEGLAAMAVAGALITINPNLTGSGPRAVVVAGPSGVGKGTLISMLMKDMEGKFGFSVSHATRKPRPGEVDGESYHFVTVPAMEAAIKNGEFIEYAPVHGNYYGTSKKSVADVCEQGKVCILDIDIQGVKSVHEAWTSEPRPLFLFIKPTSQEALEARLRGRGTEDEEAVAKRMATAKKELEFEASEEGRAIFDLVIVNDDLQEAYREFKAAVCKAHGL